MSLPHLGIHSRYEICNGSSTFEKYIEKAKFLDCDTLGICDLNTLGGTFAFQQSCKKHNINFVLGETINIKRNGKFFLLKVYVKSKRGWQNLLRISKHINVDNDGFIEEHELFRYCDDLVCVVPVDSVHYIDNEFIKTIGDKFSSVYFQFDVTEWSGNERDKKYLLSLKKYLDEFYSKIPPILIHDSYYLDKEDSHIKSKLNIIGKVSGEYLSNDQFFKNQNELKKTLSRLFKSKKDIFNKIWKESVSNLNKVGKECSTFEIPTGKLRLPNYKMDDKEISSFGNSHKFFDHLMNEGLKRIGKDNDQEYLDRLDYEKSVIDKGGFRDYFLILWGANTKCADKNNIFRGLGRGSSAGSLIAYLLDIVKIDPVKYQLYFERFLNEARILKEVDDGNGGKKWVAGSPPDIDGDYESEGRDTVKEYFIKEYGFNQVSYIGTYTELKIASSLQEFSKLSGMKSKDATFMTSLLPKKQSDEIKTITDLFKYASKTPKLKQIIKHRVDLINDVSIGIGAFKTTGVHAAGVIITPEYDDEGNRMEVWDWFPVCKRKGFIISEYDKDELEALGFLKNDMLAITQADEIKECFRLIKLTEGIDLKIEEIPLDDEKVYWMFENGYTQSVFQFNGDGMTSFVMDMLPKIINDLIAANALYRPGSMNSGMHKKYVKIKNGIELPEYLWGLEDITKDTYSVTCYQEQILKISQVVGGVTMSEADILRRAISKKKLDVMREYKDKFLSNAIKKGCSEADANSIWQIIEDNADYSFNKSHSACYAITGYVCMWLKAHYPTQFYTSTLTFLGKGNKKDKAVLMSKVLSEVNRLGEVRVLPPSINESVLDFKPDFAKNKIYWSLTSVKYVGEKAVEKIIEERERNGNFYSLQDLFDRVDKRTVNKRAINNLIISGAFDEVCGVKNESDRMGVLREFYDQILGEKLPEEFSFTYNKNVAKSWWWVLQAKMLTGLGYIDYKEITPSIFDKKTLINPIKFQSEDSVNQDVVVCGIVVKFVERNSKNGKWASMEIEHNSDIVNVLIWNEVYEKYKDDLAKCENKVVFLSGIVKFDGRFLNKNVVHSYNKTKIEVL